MINQQFRTFAKSLEKAILAYGYSDVDDQTAMQKAQVERLVKLEDDFRQALIAHRWGPGIYKEFVRYIKDEKRNILSARPYFRERQDVFSQKIGVALRKRDHEALYEFRFNYAFIAWVMSRRKWDAPRSAGKGIALLAQEVATARRELIEMNMPLAISRAKIFWSKTPRSHLEYMDFIQIAAEGLMAAIDKFVLPYTPVFRAVAIGRMLGNFIEEYSSTSVHFYPQDKKRIYRANKANQNTPPDDFESLANAVNEGLPPNSRTTPSEIQHLMAAASTVSADAILGTEDSEGESQINTFVADPASRPDIQVEENEAYAALGNTIDTLSLLEQKFLRLKGVSV